MRVKFHPDSWVPVIALLVITAGVVGAYFHFSNREKTASLGAGKISQSLKSASLTQNSAGASIVTQSVHPQTAEDTSLSVEIQSMLAKDPHARQILELYEGAIAGLDTIAMFRKDSLWIESGKDEAEQAERKSTLACVFQTTQLEQLNLLLNNPQTAELIETKIEAWLTVIADPKNRELLARVEEAWHNSSDKHWLPPPEVLLQFLQDREETLSAYHKMADETQLQAIPQEVKDYGKTLYWNYPLSEAALEYFRKSSPQMDVKVRLNINAISKLLHSQ